MNSQRLFCSQKSGVLKLSGKQNILIILLPILYSFFYLRIGLDSFFNCFEEKKNLFCF